MYIYIIWTIKNVLAINEVKRFTQTDQYMSRDDRNYPPPSTLLISWKDTLISILLTDLLTGGEEHVEAPPCLEIAGLWTWHQASPTSGHPEMGHS